MIFYIISIGIVLKVYFLTRYFYRKQKKNCFSPENFDKTLEYTKWKQKTSKIGKVLVGSYRVEVSPEDELLYKNDETLYTVFKVTREEGIVILAVKHRNSLVQKSNNAFCELLQRALTHPIVQKEH